MPDSQLLKTLQKLGGVPDDILAHEDFMRWFLPIIRADFSITEQYVPSYSPIRLPMPLIAFRGKDDQEVSDQEMRQWTHVAGGIYQEHTFPGGHFYLNTPSVLTSALREIACIVGLEYKNRPLKCSATEA
jgi:medium-chain acyl-[acyl-carrier-protein] hydrolase